MNSNMRKRQRSVAVVVHNGVRHDSRVIKQAQSLKAAGHDVRVFGLRADTSEKFLLGELPVYLSQRDLSGVGNVLRTHGLEDSRENRVWASFSEQGRLVFEAVRETMRPDVVHIHDHVSLTAASSYKTEFGVPIVWDAHEIYEELAGLEDVRRVVNPRIIRENVGLVDAFITLNESIAAVYAERYSDLPRAIIIPNAARFSGLPFYDGRLHAAAGLERDQRIVLFQGGLAPHRGIEMLAEVAAQLDERWSVVFMGWGKLERLIKERAAVLDDRPRNRARIAVVPGVAQSELPLWTSGADLGAIPYEDVGLNHHYCTPNKLWEFPASGVPILATDLPEMAKLVQGAGMGFTVASDLDVSSVAGAINGLSDEDLSKFRAGALAFIERDNWSLYEAKLLSAYESIFRPRSGIYAILRSLFGGER